MPHQFLSNMQSYQLQNMPCGYACRKAEFAPERFDAQIFASAGLKLPKELAKASAKRLTEFLAGRLLAKEVLQDLQAESFELKYRPQEAPLWPQGFAGSLSHKNHDAIALCVNDPSLSVGIDMEHWMAPDQAQKISAKVLTPQEAHWKSQSNAEELITIIFSAKEALFKMLHPTVEKFFGFQAVALVALDENEQSFQLQLQTDLGTGQTSGKIFSGAFLSNKQGVVTHLHARL
jgi:enterobactin synthetase component D